MIKVVIADDHDVFRKSLVQLLMSGDDIAVVGEAENGCDAMTTIAAMKPDIAILDTPMPGLSGTEVVREIRKKGLDTRVVLLSMSDDPASADRAVKDGAYGYVLKESINNELLTAVRSVASGRRYISPSISGDILNLRIMREGEKSATLTERETEIVGLIVRGLTNGQIAEKLSISRKTVETHRFRVMRKLDFHSTAEIVRYAIREGMAGEY